MNKAQIIATEVSKATGISLLDIVSERRHPEIVVARHMCIVLMRELTPWSLPRIARAIRRHDHTTIMHALRTWPERIRRNPDAAAHMTFARARAAARFAALKHDDGNISP